MILIPAIDLYEGKAVRLSKGDYRQMTVYSDCPTELAEHFARVGAEYLHVVDLEGAKTGETPNLPLIREIAEKQRMKVEVGGGIRSAQTVERYLQAGVDRVILGTAALMQPDFLKEMVAEWGRRIAVGVDVREGKVATHGWQQTSSMECMEFCRLLQNIGVETIICTDISRDGMLGGTNVDLYQRLSEAFDLHIIASGGVSSIQDIRSLAELKLYGAIVGKAIYEGKLDLADALACAKGVDI